MKVNPIEEMTAEIRNKLQRSQTIIEFLNKDKKIPKDYLVEAEKDFKKVLSLLNAIDEFSINRKL